MPDDDQPACFIYMARELVGKEMIDETAMIRFALTVRKNYRNVTYHNWFHAFSVAHATFVTVNREDAKFSKLEKFCLLVASLCHDLDHRGRDNSYLRKNHTPLASLYTSSPLEHHHFNMAVTILQASPYTSFFKFSNVLSLNNLETKSSLRFTTPSI
ncbi:unnamed protein product [Dibothriocephalus latus]|uniref:PDEase domain-containing protein n=1 Tax=Dibothriocephalus latus TaxID=60516 RepID=A0A3P6U4J9_DIBLA|nr:unnamed protein product [Dibothriocephalus latus]